MFKVDDWVVYAALVFLCWGLWAFIPKITVKYLDPKSAFLFEVVGGVLVALVLVVFFGFKIQTHPVGVSLAVLSGVLGFLGGLFFLFAITKQNASIVVSATSLYPIIPIALALIVFQESISLTQGAGIALAMAAVYLLTL